MTKPAIIVAILIAAAMDVSAGVNLTTWQADLQHTGQNLNEKILNPENISSKGSFGYLFSQPVDGQTYGQPLLASGIDIGGATHNIVYVATEHDSVYAFDADNNQGDNARPLWHDSLLPAGTQPVPQNIIGSSDISVEVGITTTPVIDMASRTLYVVSKVETLADTTCQQYLHALDLATGAEKFGGPVLINPTFAGSSSDGKHGVIPFNALREHSRAAMILYNGVVYITYGSHSDSNPYHGEVLGYDSSTLKLVKTFISTPNGESPEGGIWLSGAGPAIDSQGSMYVAVANGSWEQSPSPYTTGTDWGESLLKLPTDTTGALQVDFANTLNWFTPDIWKKLNEGDLDLGSSGLLILPDQSGGNHPHIMVEGSKNGVLYVVDRDDLGGIHTPNNSVQEIREIDGDSLYTTPAYFNGYIYYAASGGPLEQRAVGYDAGTGDYIATTSIISSSNYGGKGAGVFISANGTTNGIAWLLNGTGLDAYDATNVSGSPIYSGSATAPPNINCQTTKFSLPIAANGKVYFTAFDSTNTGHLFVFGLLSSLTAPEVPGNPTATAISSRQITVTWTDTVASSAGFIVTRSMSSDGPFNPVGTVGAHVTSFTDASLRASTKYYYQIVAFNSKGDSPATSIVSATTFPFFALPGLVAYWNFDDGNPAMVSDATGNGHTGTVRGEVAPSTGFINGAYTFHGAGVASSHISVPNTPALQFAASQSFTVSAWVKPANIHKTEQAVLAKSADQGNAYGIWINAKDQWIFRGPNGDLVGSTATGGAWTHVAVVQDAVANTRKLYVNGVLAGNQNGTQAADGVGDLWMGQQNVTSNPKSFPGLIDEVRLYNRALTDAEIPTLLGPPILEALSLQPQDNGEDEGIILSPSTSIVTEPRQGSIKGRYTIALNFSTPVSVSSTKLELQGGGTAVGHVDSVSYNSTKKTATVVLANVGNNQSLNLHLSGIQPGNGTADIPFNILWETK
jgi:hypothetical protein